MTDEIGYKGFDKDFKCQGFQYDVGKQYHHQGQVKCCPNNDDLAAGRGGFHYCTNPLHVRRYYNLPTSRFAIVAPAGDIADNAEDSKHACTKIKIDAEISLKDLICAGMKFTFEKIKWGQKDTPPPDPWRGINSSLYWSGRQSSGNSRELASFSGVGCQQNQSGKNRTGRWQKDQGRYFLHP